MKRLIISFLILAAIVTTSVYTLSAFDKANHTLVSYVERAEELYKQNKTDLAEEELTRLNRFWSDYYNLASYIVQSTKLEEVAQSISKLKALMGKDEFLSECESIKYGVRLIYDSEYPYLHSIL